MRAWLVERPIARPLGQGLDGGDEPVDFLVGCVAGAADTDETLGRTPEPVHDRLRVKIAARGKQSPVRERTGDRARRLTGDGKRNRWCPGRFR